jgi:hypothetical protein
MKTASNDCKDVHSVQQLHVHIVLWILLASRFQPSWVCLVLVRALINCRGKIFLSVYWLADPFTTELYVLWKAET